MSLNDWIVVAGSTPVPNPINSNPPDLSWLGPSITSAGVVIVGLFVLFSNLWQRRQNRKDAVVDRHEDASLSVQPKITDGWEEVRKARDEASQYYNLYRTFENLFYVSFGALRHLARTFRDKNPDETLDKDVVDALAIVPPDTTDASK